MNMLISNLYRKNFLVFNIYCYYMYIQYPFFLIFYFSFIHWWPLLVILIPVLSIAIKIFVFEFLVFIIFYFNIQPVYSSTYYSVIRNGRSFSMDISLYNSLGLSVWKMKIYPGISKRRNVLDMKWLSNFVFVHLF
jgi:hypothetical protein